MGTTVVAALIQGRALSFAHVGDSRLYLIRSGAIHLLTVDHSLVMEQVRDGLLTEEEAERSAQRHVVTRALGIEATVDVELGELPIMNGDLLVLCSDGLTRGVQSAKILQDIPGVRRSAGRFRGTRRVGEHRRRRRQYDRRADCAPTTRQTSHVAANTRLDL